MSNIGWSTLSVIPSAKGFGASLTKSIAPEMALAGKTSGEGFAKGMAAGVVAIAAVAVGVAVIATKMGAAFQSATTLLVTGAGESEKNIGLIRDGLIAMAPAVGTGPTALAKAMFMVESAGYHGAAGLIVMKAAAEGAKIGGADATVVANGLTTALTDYHLPASQAAVVTSKLVATVAAGKTTMQDLSGALSTILPFASSFGVSLNDITGAMATMTGEGIDAATSATMLKFTMMSMANETPKGLKALKSIGMTAQQLKDDLSTKGVGGALQIVTDMVGKKFPAGSVAATHAIAAIVGGTRGMGSALALTGTHAATLTANIKSIGGASTEAGGHVKGWAITTADLGFQFDRAKAWISALAITIGNDLIPFVTKGVKAFNDFVTGFENGTGAGGKFRDILAAIHDKGIVPLATFITGTALPALANIATWITGTGIPALSSFKDWVIKNRDTLRVLAEFIGVVLLPVFADMAVKAVASAVTQAGAWVSTQIAGGTSALAQLGSHYIIVGGWVMSTAKAVASAATTAVIWAMYKADAIAGAATTVGSLLVVAGGWIATAATAMASAVVMAAAWLIGLGPIGWVIAGVVALIAIIVVIATKTTWFGTVWRALWNGAIAPVIRFIMDGLGSILGGISNMLEALSHVPGFGWAHDAAVKLREGSTWAHNFANGIKDIPANKHVNVWVDTKFSKSGINPKTGLPVGFSSGGPVPGIGTRDTQPAMLTPGEFVVRRDGSNIADALSHFGAKAVTPAAGFDYDRLAEAVSRRQIKAVISVGSVDRALGGALR